MENQMQPTPKLELLSKLQMLNLQKKQILASGMMIVQVLFQMVITKKNKILSIFWVKKNTINRLSNQKLKIKRMKLMENSTQQKVMQIIELQTKKMLTFLVVIMLIVESGVVNFQVDRNKESQLQELSLDNQKCSYQMKLQVHQMKNLSLKSKKLLIVLCRVKQHLLLPID